jgi:glycosyltransferase involved in cell wall biosynthesis
MISVVVCTYNRARSLARTLEHLRQTSVPRELSWELIIVDNNSSDDTREVIEGFARSCDFQVRYLFEPKQGLSHARNTGIPQARGEIIAFTDDDACVSAEWLQELATTFRDFDCMAVGGKNIAVWGDIRRPEWLVTTGKYRLTSAPLLNFDFGDQPKRMEGPAWGLNMAFKKAAFVKYGLFRTDLGVCGSGGFLAEDMEFGTRLIRGGETVMYSPGAVVFHPVDANRVTKEYYLSFYFRGGKTDVRQENWMRDAVLYLGIPRFVLRSSLINLGNWFISLNKNRRFYYKLRAYRSAGQVVEALRSRRTASREPDSVQSASA